jgi:exopolysaccharide biosynthesis polyprenyl glycosylphosphotransferase
MGNPSRIESIEGMDRVLAGPRDAVSRTLPISLLDKLRRAEAATSHSAPWVVFANGKVNGLLDDLRASDLLSARDRAVVFRNGDFALQDSGQFDRSPIVVARPDMARSELMDLCQDLQRQGHPVWVLSPSLEVLRGRVPIKEIHGTPLVKMGGSGTKRLQRAVKRAIDVVGSGLGIAVLSPLLLLISLAVKLSSPGPVLFRQRRVGLNGRPFSCLKFRSMVVNNDESVHKRYWEGLRERGEEAAVDKCGKRVYKLVDDPRVTRLGRVLRRWSLDELPQLFNVLRGQMSLVGPRPCLIYEWESYHEWHKRRLGVEAGITGLWQVTARSNVSFEEMVLLDLYYAANWSLGLDIRLLLRTIPAVFNGEGAH